MQIRLSKSADKFLKKVDDNSRKAIFQIRKETGEIFIYDINYRGNIYDA